MIFLASKPYDEALGEKGIFRVTVDLKNVSDNIGTYSVHIKVDGQQILEQSRIVDTSSQSRVKFVQMILSLNVASPKHFFSLLIPYPWVLRLECV